MLLWCGKFLCQKRLSWLIVFLHDAYFVYFCATIQFRHGQSIWGSHTKRCASPVLFIPVKYQRGISNRNSIWFLRHSLKSIFVAAKNMSLLCGRKELLLAEQLLQMIRKCSLSLRYRAVSHGPWFDHAESSETAVGNPGVQLWYFSFQRVVSAAEKGFLFPGKCYSHQSTLPCVR